MSQDHRQRSNFRKLFIGFQRKALLIWVCFRFYRSHALQQFSIQPSGPCFALGVVLQRISAQENQKFNPIELPGLCLDLQRSGWPPLSFDLPFFLTLADPADLGRITLMLLTAISLTWLLNPSSVNQGTSGESGTSLEQEMK